jgi:hypothetical protein
MLFEEAQALSILDEQRKEEEMLINQKAALSFVR